MPLLAQPLTPREQEMMALIETLNERVTTLEKRVEEAEQAAPAMEPASGTPTAAAAPESFVPAPGDFRVYWDKALKMETADGQAKLTIGGRVHNDWFWYDQDDELQDSVDLEDGTRFRRARLHIGGTLYENINFKVEYDFAGGDTDFRAVYLEATKLPVIQNLQVGHFKEPFSLDELTSSNDITFMERALPNVFAPSWNTGVMAHGAFFGEPKAERMTLAAGLFRTSDDFGNDADDGGYSGTVRVTGLPWFAGSDRLLHLGAAYTHRNPDGTIRVRQRPEAGDAERFLDTGDFDADSINSVALEAAFQYGPFSIQGEYFFNDIETEDLGDRDFDGYYAQASYILTGEHRPYKHSSGVFGRPTPERNFKLHGEDRGWGAWELALRYSKIDLNDGHDRQWDQALRQFHSIRGGEEENFTLGLNWYLNPNVRVMWNYVHADLDSDVYEGDLDILQTRFQLAF